MSFISCQPSCLCLFLYFSKRTCKCFFISPTSSLFLCAYCISQEEHKVWIRILSKFTLSRTNRFSFKVFNSLSVVSLLTSSLSRCFTKMLYLWLCCIFEVCPEVASWGVQHGDHATSRTLYWLIAFKLSCLTFIVLFLLCLTGEEMRFGDYAIEFLNFVI